MQVFPSGSRTRSEVARAFHGWLPGVIQPRVAGVALALSIVIAPVWLSSSLPTCDGPSHVYNAMIASQVRSGAEPFASRYQIRSFPRSNFATDSMLRILGPSLGWETAERVVATVVLSAGMLVYFRLLGGGPGVLYAAVCAAWLANNWFFWMGFYDFALSLPIFAIFAELLRNWRGRLFWVRAAVLLFALYATHLFTFAIGVAMFSWVILWRVAEHKLRPVALFAIVLPAALLCFELLAGPAGHGMPVWTGWIGRGKAVIGWAVGDFLITFTWLSIVPGILIMALIWSSAVARVRYARRSRCWNAMDVFVIGAFVASCVVPDIVGAGTYIPARVRILTVLAVLPPTAAWFSRTICRVSPVRQRQAQIVVGVLAVLLAVHGALAVRLSNQVSEQSAAMERTLRAAGIGRSAWVETHFPAFADRTVVRISPYNHLADRALLRLALCSLDDYEATLGNFEVQWRRRPGALLWKEVPSGWSISQQRGGPPWDDNLWVLHEATRRFVSDDPDFYVEPPFTPFSQFTVTEIEVRSREVNRR